ncbi:hypothetical protein FQA47_015645 [Oryzias melastigma]|uniref:Uncharacterized protein n=1 Tax=Oryzias melastigma TaxID=30732 RepID=A0A834CC16_ORYME|nr:hypothetical protein FQA47_015645 [Oryzias melastigma]
MEPVSHDAGLAVQTSHITGSVPIPSLGFAASLQSSWSRMRHRQQCSLQHSHTHIPVGLLGGGAFIESPCCIPPDLLSRSAFGPSGHHFFEVVLERRVLGTPGFPVNPLFPLWFGWSALHAAGSCPEQEVSLTHEVNGVKL